MNRVRLAIASLNRLGATCGSWFDSAATGVDPGPATTFREQAGECFVAKAITRSWCSPSGKRSSVPTTTCPCSSIAASWANARSPTALGPRRLDNADGWSGAATSDRGRWEHLGGTLRAPTTEGFDADRHIQRCDLHGPAEARASEGRRAVSLARRCRGLDRGRGLRLAARDR